jgi:hypothetical protein
LACPHEQHAATKRVAPLATWYAGRMAHEESPREDLLREATALVERIELVSRANGTESSAEVFHGQTIVAGFRPNGALSVFFSDEEVYHFNAAGELRRAFLDGHLYKAVKGELVALSRVRTAEQVELRSRPLAAAEQAAFIAHMAKCLADLTTDLAADNFEVRRQVPSKANVLARLRTWLSNHTDWSVAARPNA